LTLKLEKYSEKFYGGNWGKYGPIASKNDTANLHENCSQYHFRSTTVVVHEIRVHLAVDPDHSFDRVHSFDHDPARDIVVPGMVKAHVGYNRLYYNPVVDIPVHCIPAECYIPVVPAGRSESAELTVPDQVLLDMSVVPAADVVVVVDTSDR